MLDNTLAWEYPKKVSEISHLLKNIPGLAFHAGGTGILRTKPSSIKVLVDLSNTDLRYIHKEKEDGGFDVFCIGPMCTYENIIEYQEHDQGCMGMLRDGLKEAASTLLRNRITIGGSVADAPPWSDLWALLLSLNARIVLIDREGNEDTISAAEYFQKKKAKEKPFIKEIQCVEKENLIHCSKRFVRVHFDYPIFKVALCAEIYPKQTSLPQESGSSEKKDGTDKSESPGKTLRNVRAFVTGVKGFYQRLYGLEQALNTNSLTEPLIDEAVRTIRANFFETQNNISGEYKNHLLRVYLKDGLLSCMERIS